MGSRRSTSQWFTCTDQCPFLSISGNLLGYLFWIHACVAMQCYQPLFFRRRKNPVARRSNPNALAIASCRMASMISTGNRLFFFWNIWTFWNSLQSLASESLPTTCNNEAINQLPMATAARCHANAAANGHRRQFCSEPLHFSLLMNIVFSRCRCHCCRCWRAAILFWKSVNYGFRHGIHMQISWFVIIMQRATAEIMIHKKKKKKNKKRQEIEYFSLWGSRGIAIERNFFFFSKKGTK